MTCVGSLCFIVGSNLSGGFVCSVVGWGLILLVIFVIVVAAIGRVTF